MGRHEGHGPEWYDGYETALHEVDAELTDYLKELSPGPIHSAVSLCLAKVRALFFDLVD